MGNLVNMTAQRHNYDDPNQAEPDAPPTDAGPRRQRRNPSSGSGGWLKTLLLAGGSAVAAVIAVDFYRNKVKGEGKDEEKTQQPTIASIAMPPQTFVPMPVPMPMPMPMPGYGMGGGGYGGGGSHEPARRMSAAEEEKAMREEMARILTRRKLGKDLERARLNAIMDEMLEDE